MHETMVAGKGDGVAGANRISKSGKLAHIRFFAAKVVHRRVISLNTIRESVGISMAPQYKIDIGKPTVNLSQAGAEYLAVVGIQYSSVAVLQYCRRIGGKGAELETVQPKSGRKFYRLAMRDFPDVGKTHIGKVFNHARRRYLWNQYRRTGVKPSQAGAVKMIPVQMCDVNVIRL